MPNQHGASRRSRQLIACWLGVYCLLLHAPAVNADGTLGLSNGQTVYVPIYSHIYAGDRESPIYLAATLSLRNIDPKHAISLIRADYFDSKGQLIKHYIESPVTLGAMASTRFVIKESDKIGGSGANFIVQWTSEQPVNPPLMESVMISTRSALGISFTSRGQVIKP